MKQKTLSGTKAAALCAAAAMLAGMAAAITLEPGAVEVVLPAKPLPVEQFAAQEMTNFLSGVLGAPVPIVENGRAACPHAAAVCAARPPYRAVSILLGRAAGFDVSTFGRDEFRTKVERSANGAAEIRIAGRDGKSDPMKNLQRCERATLHGVYAFLEDYAGVRLYFPGELGTVVPKTEKIVVPDVDRAVTPDFAVREWYNGRRAYWFGKAQNDAEGERMKRLDWLRLRMGTKKIPLCHGTRGFRFLERFGKTHPEYFAMKQNGSRHLDPNETHPCQLCWTSGVIDEFYEDVKAALVGKKPSDRGIPMKAWPSSIDLEDRVVDCMPQDGQAECFCENCQKFYKAGLDPVWAATKKIAERLTADGLDAKVTQMCYSRSRKVPEYDLPSNILVQVAVRGQWSLRDPSLVAQEHAQIFAWQKKLGHKVWLWTYPGKHPSVGPDFDGIPQLSMHAWAKYYADLRDSVIGGFSESETDRFSFNYLNYYVYSRMCWDTSIDVDAVLDEHHRLMFGAAAPPMKALYGLLEEKWVTKLVGESKDSEIGPVAVVPSWETIFREIYPPSEIARLDAFVAEALRLVPEDSLEARRIRLIADEYVGGIRAAEKRYREKTAVVDAYRAKAGQGHPISLRPLCYRGRRKVIPGTEVATTVTATRIDKALRFRFVCEEPHMDHLAEKDRSDDDPLTWQDNSVEVYLCPDGNRTRKYQIIVNSRGACYAAKIIVFGKKGSHVDASWGKGVVAKVVRGEREWTAEIEVPLSEFERCGQSFPANFTRARSLDGVKGSGLYLWGPETLERFGDSENFGTVEYADRASSTLTAETAEVLVAPDAQKTHSVAWFAAGELANFLSRAFGKTVPLVTAPTPGKTDVVVGTNVWSAAAGVDVAALPRDGFIVRAVTGRIFIAGRDMEGPFNPATDWRRGEKATLFGVYGFLEKHVGCRFYFPGEIGEVVPRVSSVAVPEDECTESPEFIERKVRQQLGEWFEPVSKDEYDMNAALCRYRWRLETRGIPCCHGLQHGHYLARFGKTHPEYFCQLKDGTRMNVDRGSNDPYRGQYCHSSAIWDEIFKDARSYFLGEGPEVRGMMAERNRKVVPGHEWRWQAAHGTYYDVMPQDNFRRCWCEKCTAAFAKAKNPAQYATELIWGRVAECAQRLIDEGVPGNLTMMSYNPYKNVPDFGIPTNVLVMVCSNGAWAKEKFQESDLTRLQAWNEKCGRKLHIWNNCGKHVCFNLNYADMPGFTPRAYGRYYKRLAPYIFGAYCDNQSEKFIHSALNYYVFSRLAWNSHTDVDALLEEYYRLMFGVGADAMRRFDEEMEDIWMNDIISTQIETALGPMNAGISSFELWTRVVDMKRIRRFEGLFDEAANSVVPDSIEARRIAFFRRQILEPMARHASELDVEGGVGREMAARAERGATSIVKDFRTLDFDIATTNEAVHAKTYPLKLKCGRAYRVSYFISGENLDQYGDTPEQLRIAKMWGGVMGDVKCDGKRLGSTGRGVRGTFRPVVQSFEFVVPGEAGKEVDAELKLQTVWTTGHARFESLLVEEKNGEE